MANFVFGDVQEIVINHPALPGGSARFYPKANESFNFDKGGIRVNDDANQITSNGQIMRQMNRSRWEVDGPIACDTITDAEMKNLNILSASPILGTIQFALISGAIYKGVGSPVGEIKFDSNAGTIPIKFSGNGELESIT